jgi:hypothetical protein
MSDPAGETDRGALRLDFDRLPSFPAYSRQRFEYAVRARRHLDIPSMQRHQRGTMTDRDDRRVRQDLAQHAVDFRFQLLVERRFSPGQAATSEVIKEPRN